VREGEAMLRLSDEGRRAALAEARALLAQRQVESGAYRELVSRGNAPRLNQEAKDAALAAAQSAVERAETELERLRIAAPFAGVVNAVPVELGQAVQPGLTVAELIDLDPLVVVLGVSERSIAGLKAGQTAQVRLVSGRTLQGGVSFISRSADPATRTYRVEVQIPNKDYEIAEGLTAEASLALDPEAATRIPRSALTLGPDGSIGIKLVEAGDVARFLPVAILDDEPEAVWITGLPSVARVIVAGQDFVAAGRKVEPVPVGPEGPRS
jgi:multidrug efflux system membrane fusion protein